MQKLVIVLLVILFASSIFVISSLFINPSAPTLYIAISGCCILAFLAVLQSYKHQTIGISASEALIGGFFFLTLTMRHPKNFSRNFLQIIFR